MRKIVWPRPARDLTSVPVFPPSKKPLEPFRGLEGLRVVADEIAKAAGVHAPKRLLRANAPYQRASAPKRPVRRAGDSGRPLGKGPKKGKAQMALYEHVFMARQDISAQQADALAEQFKKIIVDLGGKVVKAEYWGVKSLAYRIKKNRKAHFTLMNIDAPHAAIAEMERQMGINEDVLRFMTLRVEAHEETPSAMMRKREDDGERGERRGGRSDRGERSDRGGERSDRGERRPRRDDAHEGAF